MAERSPEPTERRSPSVRHVLACLDGSDLGERGVPHVMAIARALDASVTLLRVLERPAADPAPADPLQWELQRREARGYVDDVAAQFRSDEQAVEAELVEGRAAEEICRWCAEREVDLTVATTHGAGGTSPWALASTARKLLERVPGSLLIVPSRAHETPAESACYRRVLVPLDGSAEAETALPLAERIARAQGAALVIAHVVPSVELTQIGPLDREDLELVDRVRRRNERVARLYLDRVRARLAASDLSLHLRILQGNDAAARIAALLPTESIDLVVMAAQGHNARPGTPYGSVVAELIARSQVPVLIVRPRSAKAMRRITTSAVPAGVSRQPYPAAS
jgi:nucleotide-binding universal stress UspA family protein